MIQKRKMRSIIAIVPFLIGMTGFATSANAAGGNEGDNPSVMKKEQDGSVSKAEFMKHHEWMFDQNDKDKNGKLDPDEMKNLHKMVSKMHGRHEHSGHKN